MLRDSVVIVVRTLPRAKPLTMITMRKSTHGFPFLSHHEYGAPLGGLRAAGAPLQMNDVKIWNRKNLLSLQMNDRLEFCIGSA